MKWLIDFLNNHLTSNEEMASQFRIGHFMFGLVMWLFALIFDYGTVLFISGQEINENGWNFYMFAVTWNLIAILWSYLCILAIKMRWHKVQEFRRKYPIGKALIHYVWQCIRYPDIKKDKSYMMQRPFMQCIGSLFIFFSLINLFFIEGTIYDKFITGCILVIIVYHFRVWFL